MQLSRVPQRCQVAHVNAPTCLQVASNPFSRLADLGQQMKFQLSVLAVKEQQKEAPKNAENRHHVAASTVHVQCQSTVSCWYEPCLVAFCKLQP
jgi:hypothetical protein